MVLKDFQIVVSELEQIKPLYFQLDKDEKSNYAMELFQVHPYDFLIKPIDKEKIHRILVEVES